MFGFAKKNKNKQKNSDKTAGSESKSSVGTDKGQCSSDDLRSQALANVKAARANLGEDTIQKIAHSIRKLDERNSAMAAARKKLEEVDATRVRDEILSMLETKH